MELKLFSSDQFRQRNAIIAKGAFKTCQGWQVLILLRERWPDARWKMPINCKFGIIPLDATIGTWCIDFRGLIANFAIRFQSGKPMRKTNGDKKLVAILI